MIVQNDTIAYITFSHLNGTTRFKDMIIDAVYTWLPPGQPYYVVLSKMWQHDYQQWRDQNNNNNNNNTTLVAMPNRIVPLFVDCPEGKFGESPCCKQEKGLLEFLQRGLLDQYDWIVYMDDDMYVRTEYLTSYLSHYRVWLQYNTTNMTELNTQYKPTTTTATTTTTTTVQIPPIIFSGGWPAKRLGQSGYLVSKEASYQCSHREAFKYPHGQPVIYSKAALGQVHQGLKLGGLVRQCTAFDVTHDAGNAIFHWMHSIPSGWLRVAQRPGQPRWDVLITHGVGRCLGVTTDCTMHTLHKLYGKRKRIKRNKVPVADYMYHEHHVNGFRETGTYRRYGDPSTWEAEWHTMAVEDCKKGKK